jgi:two-component system sensor histidine kinase KdpD
MKSRGSSLGVAAGVLAALAAASALAGLLEIGLGLENASAVYLLAVAIVAIRWGTVAAIGAAIGAFLMYNVLFVEPRITFEVARPDELVTLLLLLFVGLVIGRLTGRLRDREQLAQRREREARALFGISRELATSHRLAASLPAVVEGLASETEMSRVWIGLGPTPAQERVMADTSPSEPIPAVATHAVLKRDRAEATAAWTRIHPVASAERTGAGRARGLAVFRVELRAGDAVIGSLWCERESRQGEPFLEETRLLAAAADQVAQAVSHERLAAAAAELEIERRSDALRSALLDSVSHDLRTPLASMRAAAGNLADPEIDLSPEERRATARAIDAEAERLNQLVGSVLDMSRIRAGSLVPELDLIPLAEIVEPVVERLAESLSSHPVTVDVSPELPSLRVDATFLSQALTNVLENAARYAPTGAPIAIHAATLSPAVVELVVEDGGAGVHPDSLPRLFERFSRIGDRRSESRRGFGLGLAVARGLVEATGGSVRAERSRLGGLAIRFELPAVGVDMAEVTA